MLEKDSTLIILNSKDASHKYNTTKNSYMKFNIYPPIYLDKSIKTNMSLTQFSCPNSLYIINDSNNTLDISVNDTSHTITVANGNYNVCTLLCYLKTNYNASLGIDGSFCDISNKITLSNDTYDAFELNPNLTSTIGGIMGFDNETSYTSTSQHLVMPYLCNFNGVLAMNIHTNNIHLHNRNSDTKCMSDIIQSIPVNPTIPFIEFVKQQDYDFCISNKQPIEHLEIMIKDTCGNLVDLNNQEFSMVFQFNLYKDSTSEFSHFVW